MAWFSGGFSNQALVENLASNGLISSERVRNAMLAVCVYSTPTSPTPRTTQLTPPPPTPGRPRPLRPRRAIRRLTTVHRPRCHDLRPAHARLSLRVAAVLPEARPYDPGA